MWYVPVSDDRPCLVAAVAVKYLGVAQDPSKQRVNVPESAANSLAADHYSCILLAEPHPYFWPEQ